MSKFLRTALLVVLGVVFVGSAALASVPDPTQSQCPTCIVYSPGGNTDLIVTVKNQTGANIVGSNVQIDFGTNPIQWCGAPNPGVGQAAGVTRVGNVVSATSDGSGQAHFPLRAGKCSNTGIIKIYADGVQLCSYGIGPSGDLDGNLLVNVSDLGLWASSQVSQDRCGDYNCDTLVNVSDLGLFAVMQLFSSSCP